MKIYTEIIIKTPAEKVWSVFSDFERWGEWNPFIKYLTPEPTEGSRIKVLIEPDGGRSMEFRPKVLVYNKERELRWVGRVFVRGLFDGEHYFRLEADGQHTLFIQGEKFSGILVPFLRKTLDSAKEGFNAMNAALKQRCESAD